LSGDRANSHAVPSVEYVSCDEGAAVPRPQVATDRFPSVDILMGKVLSDAFWKMGIDVRREKTTEMKEDLLRR